MKGVCVMSGGKGVVTFTQDLPHHVTRVTGHLIDLPKGEHGIHIHEFGDVTNGCTSAGEHLNPFDEEHGDAEHGHLGDLGNVRSHGYKYTHFSMISPRISLYGEHSVLGRSLVVHEQRDDLGMGDDVTSKTTGNSGGRLCCGVIGVKREELSSF
uniref:PlxyGVORF47 protein n=1 Tax=Plutella xylostella granulovirus TaxID=98383 RepID=A0A1B2CSE7_9BBAC|nr:PlxyGVORF47 protein [Plutella xylostella granulovirus]